MTTIGSNYPEHEWSLEEWVETLPTDHRARQELAIIKEEIRTLQYRINMLNAIIKDKESLSKRGRAAMDQAIIHSYRSGYKDGVEMYAWWKDGEQYVGSTGKRLKEVKIPDPDEHVRAVLRDDIWEAMTGECT
jgi:hypothetical protein